MIVEAAIFALIVAAQGNPGATLRDVQQSHIDANVPAPADFNRLLQRDLATYFGQTKKKKKVAVEFELLRDGPTQSGVTYPKFYAWVRLAGGRSAADRGAVRVAAIEKKRFEVSDFVSEEVIRNDPDAIYQIFPRSVCERIEAKVGK